MKTLENGKLDFGSRLSARAITGGVFCVFGCLSLCMLLAAGFGIWSFDMAEIPALGTGFWVWGLISWIVSVAVGSAVAVSSSKSTQLRDGALNAFVTWAASTMSCGLLLGMGTGQYFGFFANSTSGGFFGLFIGDALALAAALWVAAYNVKSEAKMEKQGHTEEQQPVDISSVRSGRAS